MQAACPGLREWPGSANRPCRGVWPRAEVEARMMRGLLQVVGAHANEAPVLVISHGGAIRTFLAAVDGVLVPPMQNAECYRVHHAQKRFTRYARL